MGTRSHLLWRKVGALWSWSSPRLKAAAILLGQLVWRLLRLIAALLRAGVTLLLAALIRLVELTKGAASRTRQRLGPSSIDTTATSEDRFYPAAATRGHGATDAVAHGEASQGRPVETAPSPRLETGAHLLRTMAPAAITTAAPSPEVGADAMPVLLAGDSDQLQQALVALGQRGVAVTTVLREPRGMRVRGVVDGRPTTSWYSLDECAQLIARHVATAPRADEVQTEAIPVERVRRVRPTIALVGVALVAALSLSLIVRSLPEERLYVTVVQPTSAYSEYGDVLWTAVPGDQYRVLKQDGDWIYAVSVPPGPPREGRFVQGTKVRVESDRPGPWQVAASWAGRLGGLVDGLLR